MTLILGVMFILIISSLVLEKILPAGVKNRAGIAICWSMMFITMTFLTLSTVALLALWVNKYILA